MAQKKGSVSMSLLDTVVLPKLNGSYEVVVKSYKEITVELNEKYLKDGTPTVFKIDPKVLADKYSLDSISVRSIDRQELAAIKDVLKDQKVIPYKDIKRMYHGKSVIYEDYLAL